MRRMRRADGPAAMLMEQIVQAARAAARAALPAELSAGVSARVDAATEPLFARVQSLMDALTADNCGYELPTPGELLPQAGTDTGHRFKYSFAASTPAWRVGRYSACVVTFSEQPAFTVLAFCLGDGKQIPLHNHPGMHGYLKVVRGSVKVTSYSLLDDELTGMCYSSGGQSSHYVPTAPPAVATLTASSPCVHLEPHRGNIHRVQAVGRAPAAFVDVLMPSYSDRDGRQCSYYRELSAAECESSALRPSVDGRPIAWLQILAQPDDYSTVTYPVTKLEPAHV